MSIKKNYYYLTYDIHILYYSNSLEKSFESLICLNSTKFKLFLEQ